MSVNSTYRQMALNAVKSDGTVVEDKPGTGCTLANSTTYYFPLGNGEGLIPAGCQFASIQLKWSAAVAAVFTVETTNFPCKIFPPAGPDDVTDYSSTAGDWLQLNPADAYVPVSGSGNSATLAAVTAGGSAAGGALFDLAGLGTRRIRIKAVVTTGGTVRAQGHGKE